MRSPGTAYVLLHHYMGEIDGAFRAWGFARGGTGAISNAIADSARELGVEIKTQVGVAQILVRDGKAVGVATTTGDEYLRRVVSSSVDPNLTFLKFIEPKHLSDDFRDEVKRYKYRGSSGKVNLALDGLPNFTCLPGEGNHLRGAISISPSVDYMERAYDEAKYGDYSQAALHRHGDPQPHRSFGRAARQARDVVLRAVRSLQAERRQLGREDARRSATP